MRGVWPVWDLENFHWRSEIFSKYLLWGPPSPAATSEPGQSQLNLQDDNSETTHCSTTAINMTELNTGKHQIWYTPDRISLKLPAETGHTQSPKPTNLMSHNGSTQKEISGTTNKPEPAVKATPWARQHKKTPESHLKMKEDLQWPKV